MELILDTANLSEIKESIEWYNLTGVTTNPTILSREKTNIIKLLYDIKSLIGNRQLHVQVLSDSWEGMVEEGVCLSEALGREVYVKIPSNLQGYRAMKELKQKGIHVTATVIYSPEQALIAGLAGADYVAVYYNKMSNVNMDPAKTVEEISALFGMNHIPSKILAASFRNTCQIIDAFLSGAHAVTLPAAMLKLFSENPVVTDAVEGFKRDWQNSYGDRNWTDLLK